MNKEGVTPLVATALLILLAIAVGTAAMSWEGSKNIVSEEKPSEQTLCNPINSLKIKYVNGEITEEEYSRMKQVIGES